MKLFHACPNQMKQKNHIKQVLDEQNVRHAIAKNIKEAFRGYFSNLFTSAGLSRDDIEQCTRVIQLKISEEMNEKLM